MVLLQNGHDDHKENCADGIKGNMDHAGALGVLAGADGADHGGGDAGAQVDAHDDGIDHGEGHGAGRRKGLEHTHHGGRTLDHYGQHQTGQNAQQRVPGESGQNGGELRGIGQRVHGGGHVQKAGEQDAEADENIADSFYTLALHEHDENDAHHQGDLGGDGGADVGAQDDGDGLPQGQHARTDQGHGQHDGSGGALNDGRDQRTGEHAHQDIAGDLFQYLFQGCAGTVFQTVAHDLDTVEEHGQATQQLDDGKNIHTLPQ